MPSQQMKSRLQQPSHCESPSPAAQVAPERPKNQWWFLDAQHRMFGPQGLGQDLVALCLKRLARMGRSLDGCEATCRPWLGRKMCRVDPSDPAPETSKSSCKDTVALFCDWIAHLTSLPGVDCDRIGLFGFSAGAYAVPATQ